MDLIACPHCKSRRIVARKVPKEVVVVMACPSCNELLVLFRKKVVALDRNVLEEGTMDERKQHLASVIAEFIDESMFKGGPLFEAMDPRELFSNDAIDFRDEGEDDDDGEEEAPISDREVEKFLEVELHRLDDASYFRKYFG